MIKELIKVIQESTEDNLALFNAVLPALYVLDQLEKKENPEDWIVEASIKPNNKALGRRMASLRVAKRLTQAELGSLIGVTGPYISELENGKRKWTDHMLSKVLTVLDQRERS